MNATTSSGQYIMASDNHTLTVGQSLVQVVTPDVILQNGVVHVINGVFLDTNTNAGAASSAYVSATSAAGTAPKTTETAPIGNTATMSMTGSGASSSSSSGSGGKNGAVSFGISPVAVAASLVGVLAGGLMTLA
jgi:type IV secretory pathway TrbL component